MQAALTYITADYKAFLCVLVPLWLKAAGGSIGVAPAAERFCGSPQQLPVGVCVRVMAGNAGYFSFDKRQPQDRHGRHDIDTVLGRSIPVGMAVQAEAGKGFVQGRTPGNVAMAGCAILLDLGQRSGRLCGPGGVRGEDESVYQQANASDCPHTPPPLIDPL